MRGGIDGYLTAKARLIWPNAQVKWRDTGRKDKKGRAIEEWWIEVNVAPGVYGLKTALGPFFLAAKKTINELLREHRKAGSSEKAS